MQLRTMTKVQLVAAGPHHELDGEDGRVVLVLDASVGVGAMKQHVYIIPVSLLDSAVGVKHLLIIAIPNNLQQQQCHVVTALQFVTMSLIGYFRLLLRSILKHVLKIRTVLARGVNAIRKMPQSRAGQTHQ